MSKLHIPWYENGCKLNITCRNHLTPMLHIAITPTPMSTMTEVLESLLTSRRRTFWYVGSAARARLMDAPAPSVNHLVADISTSERDELLTLADQAANRTEKMGIPSGVPAILQCTSGEPIATVLAHRGFTIDAIATNLGGEVVDLAG